MALWALLACTVSLLEAPAVQGAKPSRACRRECGLAKARCSRQVLSTFAVARSVCAGDPRARRDCIGAARTTRRAESTACRRAYRATCVPCCRTGAAGCATRCGDAIVEPTVGEQCDPPGYGCDATCRLVPLPSVETHYDVVYSPDAVVVDAEAVRSGLIAETDAQLRFRGDTTAARALQPGQVALFAGTSVRRIVAVSETGGEIVVDTAPATLSDAITSGTLAWQHEVAWDALAPAMAAAITAGVPRSSSAAAAGQNVLAFDGKVADWDVKVRLEPTAGRCGLSIETSRSAAGKKLAAVKIGGYITNFRHEGQLTYDGGSATRISVQTDGLRGEMNIAWAALGIGDPSLDSGVAWLKIPVQFPIPFAVGPVPMTLWLKASVQVVPELGISKSSSGGSFKVTFDSSQGFTLDPSRPSTSGGLQGSQSELTGETGSAAFGPVGFAVGVEFPRLELAVLNAASAYVTLKTYTASLFTPGTTLTNDIPPCQMAYTDLFAAVGWKLGILGSTAFALEGGPQQIWKAPRYEVFKDGVPCSLTGRP